MLLSAFVAVHEFRVDRSKSKFLVFFDYRTEEEEKEKRKDNGKGRGTKV